MWGRKSKEDSDEDAEEERQGDSWGDSQEKGKDATGSESEEQRKLNIDVQDRDGGENGDLDVNGEEHEDIAHPSEINSSEEMSIFLLFLILILSRVVGIHMPEDMAWTKPVNGVLSNMLPRRDW